MPPRQQSAFAFFMLVLFIWLLFPEGDIQRSLAIADVATAQLAKYHDALTTLNQTRWGDFLPPNSSISLDSTASGKFINLTGFREEDHLAWGDLSRFREKGLALSRYAVPLVDGEQLWDVGKGDPIWTNVSGIYRGEWIRTQGSVYRTPEDYNLTASVPHMEWLGDKHSWARNLTGASGRVLLRMEGNKTIESTRSLNTGDNEGPVSGANIRTIKGTANFEDTVGSGYNWELRMWGVHWPDQGVVMMTTTSEKFQGIFGLPHLSPSADFYRSSQQLLNKTLAGTLMSKEKNLFMDPNSPWNSEIENSMYTMSPSPHCEYIMYGQIHPPSRGDLGINETEIGFAAMAEAISNIELELELPRGAPVQRVPELKMSTVIWSPDCAFFLESKGPPEVSITEGNHLAGVKNEIHLHRVKSWLLIYALVIFAQVYLMKNQMKESYTPSTMGRVSFGTASILVVVDGMVFTAAATWVLSAASTFLPTMALTFAAFMSMTLGGSFLAKIYEVQTPNRRSNARRTTQRPATTATSSSVPTTNPSPTPTPAPGDSLLPGPVTAPRASPASEPIIIPSDQDIDAEIAAAASAVPGATTAPRSTPQTFQSLLGRYILFSLCLSFLAISSTTWYPNLRSAFLNTCIFLYLSLWVPQIYRNTIRNCRRALNWQFVIGQSILRLLPIAYFWCKTDNFIYARPERRAFAVFCIWIWIQLVVLAAQDIIGPRFGVPKGWTPEAWDYHPVLREDSIETGGLPIGLMADDNPGLERVRSGPDSKEKKKSEMRSTECSICREVLEVPVVKAGEEDSSVTGAFARRMYMVTPCRHVFHTTCLEGWMKFRLQCPICREDLPPL